MSREVRRVPLGWKHPDEFNPYWETQALSRARRAEPASRLHGLTERFVPLFRESFTERDRGSAEGGS